MKNTCVDLLIKAHKKLNYIEGFRRIVLVIIGFGILCALFSYVCTGFIFDTSKFERNAKVQMQDTKIEYSLYDFCKIYMNFSSERYYIPDINCFPYKQYCMLEKVTQINKGKQIITTAQPLVKKNEFFIDEKIEVKMPTILQYFTWQVLDLLLIFGLAFLAWALYLAIEMILVWIFAGFKSDKSNNGK